jgi:preprotein translocase subunit Sec63
VTALSLVRGDEIRAIFLEAEERAKALSRLQNAACVDERKDEDVNINAGNDDEVKGDCNVDSRDDERACKRSRTDP